MKHPSLIDVVENIHRNGGKAELAYPHLQIKDHETLLSPLLKTKIDGIKDFSSYHTPSQALHYVEEANRARLFYI